MKKKIFLALLLATSVTIAAPTSSDIHLGGGKLNPTQQLKISLNTLVPNIAYDVTCHVTDQNNPKNKVILSTQTEYTSGAVGEFVLNGKDLGTATWSVQYQLPQTDNYFVGTSLYNFCGSLNFTNTDQNDPVDIDCSATAVSANK